jgi:predicted MPP superfamily phosphohydrolase
MTIGFLVTVAVFLGLLFFLISEIRHPARNPDSPWPKRFRIVRIVILVIAGSLAVWAFFIEPNRLVTRYEMLQIDQWPPPLSGLKIALLADLHAGSAFINEAKLRTIVERTNQLNPDLILIAGDFVAGGRDNGDRMEPEVFAPILKNLRAPLGVYAVLGNHDWWYNARKVRAALEANGIKLLENDFTQIENRGSSFFLVGLSDLWEGPQQIQETIAKIPAGPPVIALTHNPDIFPQLPQRVTLLLAGHTHGGQVRFPFIGTVVQSSRYGDRYVAGHVVENGHHLFVTTGIGTSIVPVRFGNPPEIVLLTLRSAS